MFFQVPFLLVGSPVGKDGMETVEAWGRVGAGESVPETAESLLEKSHPKPCIETQMRNGETQLEMVWPVLTQIGVSSKDWSNGDSTIVLSLCDFFFQSCIRKKKPKQIHLINISPFLYPLKKPQNHPHKTQILEIFLALLAEICWMQV